MVHLKRPTLGADKIDLMNSSSFVRNFLDQLNANYWLMFSINKPGV